MTRPGGWLSILLAAGFALATPAGHGAVVYRPGEGVTVEEEDSGPAARSAGAQLEKAQALETAGELKKSLSAYRIVVRKWPTSDAAAKAQFSYASVLERLESSDKAFEEYQKYLKNYPRGQEFDAAVEAQFKIAGLFLEGRRQRLLGVPTFPSMQRAQTMFESIVATAPYSQWAPRAQFSIGQALEKQGAPAKAVEAYQTVVVRYPNDAIADDAQYQIGFVYLTQARQGSYDQRAADKAQEAFEDFMARYPDSEKVPQAKENLASLTKRETKGSLEIARFYDKQKNYKAAVIYYNDVIRQQPGSPESDVAKSRIAELKSQVGEDVLRAGPERAETGATAVKRRRTRGQVDTAARPDYAGPPVIVPDEVEPERPRLRTSPTDIGPVPAVEPPLPSE